MKWRCLDINLCKHIIFTYSLRYNYQCCFVYHTLYYHNFIQRISLGMYDWQDVQSTMVFESAIPIVTLGMTLSVARAVNLTFDRDERTCINGSLRKCEEHNLPMFWFMNFLRRRHLCGPVSYLYVIQRQKNVLLCMIFDKYMFDLFESFLREHTEIIK